MDDSQLVDERLGIEQTGDVIVIDLIYETSDSYITMSTVSDTEGLASDNPKFPLLDLLI
jgi:hypothetical protein